MIAFSMPRTALASAALIIVPVGAHAELGGAMATVHGDSVRMSARMTTQAMTGYMRHTLVRANGGIVRELTNSGGQVFAVIWSGPGKPDLRALLGGSFATYQAASGVGAGRGMRGSRRPPQVNRSDLQIETAGHMGWFRGIAYLPALAPAGFSPGDLAQEQP